MAVIAVRCKCGETHRLHFSRTLATGFRKPPARATDCRRLQGRAPNQPLDPAIAKLEAQPVRDELALAFC